MGTPSTWNKPLLDSKCPKKGANVPLTYHFSRAIAWSKKLQLPADSSVSNIMSSPAEVSDVYKLGDQYAVNADFERKEYRVAWHGNWRDSPDLASFPQIPGATITPVQHSPQVGQLWARSQVLRYGADSHIRLLDEPHDADEEQFLVCKVATDERQRLLIVGELEMLRELGAKGAPVVHVHSELLTDEDGVFGFRMEKLSAIGFDTVINEDEIMQCLQRIHEHGVVHNDFHPGNVMRDHAGQLTVIDFERLGRAGAELPKEKRPPWWPADSYSFEADYILLKRFFRLSQPGETGH